MAGHCVNGQRSTVNGNYLFKITPSSGRRAADGRCRSSVIGRPIAESRLTQLSCGMAPPGASFGALRYRNFRLFIAGQFVSLCGSWMQLVALGWPALELPHSALKVGLVTTLGALPVLMFTLYGGVVADRVNKRRALI